MTEVPSQCPGASVQSLGNLVDVPNFIVFRWKRWKQTAQKWSICISPLRFLLFSSKNQFLISFSQTRKKTYDLSVMLMHSLTADLSTGPIPVKSLTGLFRDQIFANKYIRRDNQEHCAARNKETEAANCGSCPTHTLPIPLRGNIRLSSEGRLWKICVDVNHSVFESW